MLAQAEGCGPKDTPEKLEPGGRASLSCPSSSEAALGRHHLPESFLSGNLEPAPDDIFFQGRGRHGLGLWQ